MFEAPRRLETAVMSSSTGWRCRQQGVTGKCSEGRFSLPFTLLGVEGDLGQSTSHLWRVSHSLRLPSPFPPWIFATPHETQPTKCPGFTQAHAFRLLYPKDRHGLTKASCPVDGQPQGSLAWWSLSITTLPSLSPLRTGLKKADKVCF